MKRYGSGWGLVGEGGGKEMYVKQREGRRDGNGLEERKRERRGNAADKRRMSACVGLITCQSTERRGSWGIMGDGEIIGVLWLT